MLKYISISLLGNSNALNKVYPTHNKNPRVVEAPGDPSPCAS